jgi:predicted PurR-regulated permease PerM
LLVCVAAVGAVLALFWYLQVIVLPAIIALTVAPALTPLDDRLRRLGLGRAAPGLTLLVGILVVLGLVSLVTAAVAEEYDSLSDAFREGVDDLTEWLEGPPLNLSLNDDRSLGDSLRDAWAESSDYLVSGVRSGLELITGLVLAVALLYFILRDGQALWRRVLRLFSPASRASVDRAGRRAWDTLSGYIRGAALIALIDATLIGLGLWILGVPLAFALAVLIFLGAFVPFVGATVTGLVAVLVAFADGGMTMALIALGIVVGVQFVEGNFLQPIIQSRTVDLHPAGILLAVAAGGALFGIVGAYLAVPVVAVAVTIFTSLRAERGGAPAADPEAGNS